MVFLRVSEKFLKGVVADKMGYSKRKIKNRVGYCSNKDLPGMKTNTGGHYVYISKVNNNGTCDVNVVTSLEDGHGKFNDKRLFQVRIGNTYPIPVNDSNFSRWSGINADVIRGVKISKVKQIGFKRIRKRHNFYLKKFMYRIKKR